MRRKCKSNFDPIDELRGVGLIGNGDGVIPNRRVKGDGVTEENASGFPKNVSFNKESLALSGRKGGGVIVPENEEFNTWSSCFTEKDSLHTLGNYKQRTLQMKCLRCLNEETNRRLAESGLYSFPLSPVPSHLNLFLWMIMRKLGICIPLIFFFSVLDTSLPQILLS
jgi:hypothetical protein